MSARSEGSAAAEQAAKPAAPPAELADQVHGREAQLLEDAGVLVGVDGAGQLLVGLLRLGVVALVAEELEDLVLVDLHVSGRTRQQGAHAAQEDRKSVV